MVKGEDTQYPENKNNSVGVGKCGGDEYERRVNRERFGYEEYTPIRVNGSVGSITYLSRLVTEDEGKFLLSHWLGCLRLKERDIDVHEAVSPDGKFWTFLYFDCLLFFQKMGGTAGDFKPFRKLSGRYFR